ncbi:MAG: CDP-2,3-bis-(O-geranylgeranyl)-sn-glycerol synthase [Candidatus Micrarchaeota archaeon]
MLGIAGFDAVKLAAFILPAYLANSAPLLFGGGSSLDLERKLSDGRRLLGNGKTWRGLLAGVVFGTFTGFALAVLFPAALPLAFRDRMMLAFLLSLGTMAGDVAGSFIKRRAAIAEGSQHEFFDQLLFLGGALLLAAPVMLPQPSEIIALVTATYVLHKATNWLAHKASIKSVPW